MITKKKLKTRFDYQMRTLGVCVLLIAVFTFLVISPRTNNLNNENVRIKQEIEEQSELNTRLKNEFNDFIEDKLLKLVD